MGIPKHRVGGVSVCHNPSRGRGSEYLQIQVPMPPQTNEEGPPDVGKLVSLGSCEPDVEA
jgi:hypothetical protein